MSGIERDFDVQFQPMKSWIVVPLLWLSAGGARIRDSPESQVVQPKLVIPGEWMVDKAESFMFLPLTVPQDMPLDQTKIMSNGQQILVVVTEKPQEQPDTNALKKYKLLVEAIKQEAGHDEKLLQTKLQTWYDTEEDDEVRVHVRAALDSLVKVAAAKDNKKARTVAVPLGMLAKEAVQAILGKDADAVLAPSFLARATSHNVSVVVGEPQEVVDAERALPTLHVATSTQTDGQQKKKKLRVGIIKESFAVEIPYPVDTETVFILKSADRTLMVGMPLKRNSLEAKGISTGGKPFLRVPVFSVKGEHLAGPASPFQNLVGGLHVPSVASQQGLKPLP